MTPIPEGTEHTSTGFDLTRFVEAQAPVYDSVVEELRSARKRSHWMWFIFPQLRGLGRSTMAHHFGLQGRDEAMAYGQHPVLGPRLTECTKMLLAIEDRSATAIFGTPDDLKLHSCLTLFDVALPSDDVFHRALERYFEGRRDELTLRLLAKPEHKRTGL